MALTHGPRAVTDELALYLDAANPKSYLGSGSSWIDLVSNRTATLLNNPTYNSNYFTFNGTNQSISFSNSVEVSTNGFTICLLLKVPSTQLNGVAWSFIIADRDTGAGDYETGIFSTNSTSFIFKENASTPSTISAFLGTGWNYLCYGQNSSSQPFIYRNGILVDSSTSIWPTVTLDFTRVFARDNNTGYFACDCSLFQVYRKGLSTAEAYQNFQSFRGRFGL